MATKLLSGSIVKCVVCEQYGRNYSYDMKRSVVGKSSKDAIDLFGGAGRGR